MAVALNLKDLVAQGLSIRASKAQVFETLELKLIRIRCYSVCDARKVFLSGRAWQDKKLLLCKRGQVCRASAGVAVAG